MKLSVIMPCYNVEKTLARALDSVLMQKVNFSYEIIVVNDASTDKTLDIASSYSNLHNNIVVISNQENQGKITYNKLRKFNS